MTSKITGPFFRWFGGKWNASKHYPKPTFWDLAEPFAGSACYSLRHHEQQITIYDTDPHLRQLWPWLIGDATSADILDIPINLAIGTDIRQLGLSDGQALLLKTCQRTNNVGNCWTVSSWGNKPGQWTANHRARVAEQIHAIKHWRFEPVIYGAGETYFVDPPYQYNYQYRSPRIDYAALATTLYGAAAAGAQVIVCEALCAKTGARPDWLPFLDFRSTVTSRRKATQSHHSSELIWCGP